VGRCRLFRLVGSLAGVGPAGAGCVGSLLSIGFQASLGAVAAVFLSFLVSAFVCELGPP
jgi:hypothetical protein